MSINKDLAILI